MEKIKNREHDFGAKLRQGSVIENLKSYVNWERAFKAGEVAALPDCAPISINLDLTAACNFACPHCVDSGIINTGEALSLGNIKASLKTLTDHGLKSVILIGGGEPTLHPNFAEILTYAKELRLQVGLVTNGSRLHKVLPLAGLFEERDWVRLSIDAATEDTFFAAHRQASGVTLEGILANAKALKAANPKVQLGYSFVVVWEGIEMGGRELTANVSEMAGAVKLARAHGFDYISFKPCLVRLEGSGREALFNGTVTDEERRIVSAVSQNLAAAHAAAEGQLKVLESVNLRAMLENKVVELKHQPATCHSQFFRTVVAPAGIFHCPAFRGVEKGRIANCDGYASEESFQQTQATLAESLRSFDACSECNVVVCFYHHVNWWIENLAREGGDMASLEAGPDGDFFF